MRNALKVLDKSLEVFCVLLLASMMFLIFGQVFWRYVLQDPLTWSEEFSRLLFTYMSFFAAAVAMRRGRALRITVLVEMLPGRVRHIIDLVTHTLSIIFLVIIIVQSKVVIDAIGYHEAPATGLQVSLFYYSLPIAAVSMIVYLILQMLDTVDDLKAGRDPVYAHTRKHDDEDEVLADTTGDVKTPALAVPGKR